jgi:hypothetical protein
MKKAVLAVMLALALGAGTVAVLTIQTQPAAACPGVGC